MSESHEHVDLHVLREVELLLGRPDIQHEAATEDDLPAADLIVLPTREPSLRAPSTTHPAAHVPEQPLIPTAPVTPLPRRR